MIWSPLERQARRLMLPRAPKAVLKALVHYAKPDGTSMFPSILTLMAETDYSERTVRNALRYLEQEGWIIPVWMKGGRGRCSSYRLELNEFQAMIQVKPAPVEPKPLAQQERFIAGLLKKSPARLSEARRVHWQTELARVQAQLGQGQESQADDVPTPEPERFLPVPATVVDVVPAFLDPFQDAAEMAREQAEENRLRAVIEDKQRILAKLQPESRAWRRYRRTVDQAQATLDAFVYQHFGSPIQEGYT